MKRIFDLLAGVLLLILFGPLMVVVAILVKLKLGSPILFCQQRPGLHGKPFRLCKFRTMLSGDLPDDQRLTSFGKLLRATSLDELPELLNVIKGEMSLVGPRPLLMSYLPRYSAEQMRRHEVLPGITGWAQVSGRNAVSWEDRFAMDVWYVENRSFLLDLKILYKTAQVVFKREGVSADGHVTMPEFLGERP